MISTKEERLSRNAIYDFLRFIGIICIILAHIGIPDVLAQIRNFDVPFLVILSGIAYTQFSSQHHTSYLDYLIKRFYRLIVPTWIFLTIYTFSFYTFDQISIKNLLFSYSLLGHEDIGVWIIRIFFSMALLAPILFWWNKKLDTNSKFYLFMILAYIFYTIVYIVTQASLSGKILTMFNVIFMYTISYGLLYLYGIRLNSFSSTSLKMHFLTITALFISYLGYYWIQFHSIYPTQKFKYPPEGYYFSYALLVSIFLFYVSKFTKAFNAISQNKFIIFVGSSTFWIYLWHWYFLKLYYSHNFDLHYIIKFLVIFLLTVALVFLQNKVLLYILNKFSFKQKTKKIFITIFTG